MWIWPWLIYHSAWRGSWLPAGCCGYEYNCLCEYVLRPARETVAGGPDSVPDPVQSAPAPGPACRVPNVSFRPLTFPCDRSRPGRRLDLVPVQNGMWSKAKNVEENICLPIQFPKLAGSAPAGRRLNVSSRPRIAPRPIEKNNFMCGVDTSVTVANASVLARPQQGGKTRRSGGCSSCRCGSPKQTPTFITLAERRTDGRRPSATPSVCKARQSPQKLWSPPKGLCVRCHPLLCP